MREPHLIFWQLYHGLLLDMAVLDWCKLFGTDNEATHWKKLVDDHDAFRKRLLEELGIGSQEFEEYWKEMTRYRTAEVAHYLLNSGVSRYPSLELALRSSYVLYDYIQSELEKLGVAYFPRNLKDYAARYATEAVEIARVSQAATNDIDEAAIS